MPSSPSAAVQLRDLSKRFRVRHGMRRRRAPAEERLALQQLSLEVAGGGITGIIGVNGSGKSTLIRVLATLMLPDAGSARVFGRDVVSEAAWVRRHINRVSVEAAFIKALSPWENLLYAARLYGMAAGFRARAEEVLERLGLPADSIDRPMKQLSRGQQQKVSIARSLLTSPSLLLMDEPTTGLDPHSKRDVQAFIRLLCAEREVTILLCTHDLAEAEALCERIVVLDQGRMVADGTPAALCSAYGRGERIDLEEAFLRLTGRHIEDEVGVGV